MSFDGAFYKVPRVRVNPKPLQKPHPPLWAAAVSPDTYTLAAKRGLKILTSPAFTPLDILRKNYDAYHAEWKATHGTGDGAEICMNKIIHVAETSKQAREDLREPCSGSSAPRPTSSPTRRARRPRSTSSTSACARTCSR
jgi:alkanesulfonate monooxygenase SsuD/methylene tetrahydromethanopterin reductase-like flavin-dependent oxidoreductase (luciferase family)